METYDCINLIFSSFPSKIMRSAIGLLHIVVVFEIVVGFVLASSAANIVNERARKICKNCIS